MSEQNVARRYARALFNIAREQGTAGEFANGLEEVSRTLAENSDFRRVLYHQLIPVREKQKLIDTIFPDINPLLKNFLHLVLAKGRERALPEMAAQFRRLVDQAENILPVEVTSAITLREDILAGLKERLAGITRRNIRLSSRVNPELIGGVVIRLGDRVLDVSVKKKLELLGEHLKRA
ncbi:ATP synthase subunit delta [Moorella thermoacetica]|uniref:ATP synthase F1 subunit delta n=1 Tax=Neomoorella thermoacetica TaxID=1525 RepID=UPI00069FC3C9|nr:ATP synthase F1 subunit delta [Moorella thermoacetica]AKX95239.1 ATP synthase subunit delta [Moorella thermoacetica]